MTHMRNELRRMYHGGKELKRMYHQKKETWSGLATYEKSNSILEYTWRQYRLGTNYRWDVYNLTYGYSRTSSGYSGHNTENYHSGGLSYSFNSSTGTFSLIDYGIYLVRNYPTVYEIGSNDKILYKYTEKFQDYERGNVPGSYSYERYDAYEMKGSSVGTVTSSSSNTYPNPGASGDYYYDNRTSYYVRGTYIKDVTSTNSSAYSTNGVTGSYWYDTRTSAYIKGNLIGNVEAEEGTYPTNGRHTDGFWYILQS